MRKSTIRSSRLRMERRPMSKSLRSFAQWPDTSIDKLPTLAESVAAIVGAAGIKSSPAKVRRPAPSIWSRAGQAVKKIFQRGAVRAG